MTVLQQCDVAAPGVQEPELLLDLPHFQLFANRIQKEPGSHRNPQWVEEHAWNPRSEGPPFVGRPEATDLHVAPHPSCPILQLLASKKAKDSLCQHRL